MKHEQNYCMFNIRQRFRPPDWEYYKNRLNFVKCIQCEINKAKDYTFTFLAKKAYFDQRLECTAPKPWPKYTTKERELKTSCAITD